MTGFPAPPEGPRETFDSFRAGSSPPRVGVIICFKAKLPGSEAFLEVIRFKDLIRATMKEDELVLEASLLRIRLRKLEAEESLRETSLSIRRPKGLDWSIFLPEASLSLLEPFLARSLSLDAGVEGDGASSLAASCLHALFQGGLPA